MDVKELLESKHIHYIPSGLDYKILCLNPEHDDSNPSLRVDSLTGIFHCFACGFKGNLFQHFGAKANVLQIKRELIKKKIRQKYAENIGMEIPEDAVFYDGDWRGISGDTYKRFEAFEHHAPQFIGRLVFPIRGISGKIVAFTGRALTPEKQPRYLVEPPQARMPLYPGRPDEVYQGSVVLVEGLFDMLNLYDKGLRNVVCAFGTKLLNKDKLSILKMQGVSNIDIMFDADEAGQAAAEEAKKLIDSIEMTHRTVSLKSGDPGDLTAQKVLKLKEKLYGENSAGGDQA